MAFMRLCFAICLSIIWLAPSSLLADDKRLDLGIKPRSIPLAPPAKPAGLALMGIAVGKLPQAKSAPPSGLGTLVETVVKPIVAKPEPAPQPVSPPKRPTSILVGGNVISVKVLKVVHTELVFLGPVLEPVATAGLTNDETAVRLGTTSLPRFEVATGQTPAAAPELKADFQTVRYVKQDEKRVPQLGSKPVSLAAFKGLELKPQEIALFVEPSAILPTQSKPVAPVAPKPPALARLEVPKRLAPAPKPLPQKQTPAKPPALRAADNSCFAKLRAAGAVFSRVDPFRTPKGCGMNGGVMLKSVQGIDIVPEAQLDCPFALRIAKWVGGDFNQTVMRNTGAPLKSVRHYSAYRCTFRSKGRLSEHATGNAFDLAGFETSMGTKLNVLKDWGNHMNWAKMEPMTLSRRKEDKRPTVKEASQKDNLSQAKRQVWYEVTRSACRDFQLVLTPHSNKAHDNHLHIDQGRWKQCEL